MSRAEEGASVSLWMMARSTSPRFIRVAFSALPAVALTVTDGASPCSSSRRAIAVPRAW